MSETTPTPKTRKPRAPRRNFEKIISDTRTYCEAAIDVLNGQLRNAADDAATEADDLHDAWVHAQIGAFKAVLARLGER